ncbi:TniB family NTP-binding protein [Herminiimonas aquatilis]|uniref:TniB family NTP-binding protein n=1 Tax=Herminiimonas aquatilis TaxID=345342 RepID=A0ABW2J4I2_9BURK
MKDLRQKNDWKGVPWPLRQRYMANELHVPHPPLMRIVKRIYEVATDCKNTGVGDAMIIVGGSGSGKSHLIKIIRLQRPVDHSGDISVVPVVSFSIPSSPTQRSMSSALLAALEHPKSNRGNATEMFNRAITQLKAVGTEIIMIDNLHDIPERRRAGGVMQVGNWIRDLIDQSGCLIVLLGTPLAKMVTEANSQLRRRVAKQLVIDYFDISTEKNIGVLKRFLRELDARIPLAEDSCFSDSSVVLKLYWATLGVADYIFRIIKEATGLAVATGEEKISLQNLEEAFVLVFQDSAKGINPFALSGPERLLDGPGEPFHNWFDESNPRMSGRAH